MTMRLDTGDRLLFVGDSVTSCGYENIAAPWGAGFVLFVDVQLSASYPQKEIEVINRGVAGDTVVDMARRWETDVIDVEHDWLFIMIGLNDVSFRHMDNLVDGAVTDEVYRETYRRLLARVREALSSKIVLIEPTPIFTDPQHQCHEEMRTVCGIVAELAEEFGTEICRLHERFCRRIMDYPERTWMLDHVHPSFRGHGIIASSIIEHLGC